METPVQISKTLFESDDQGDYERLRFQLVETHFRPVLADLRLGKGLGQAFQYIEECYPDQVVSLWLTYFVRTIKKMDLGPKWRKRLKQTGLEHITWPVWHDVKFMDRAFLVNLRRAIIPYCDEAFLGELARLRLYKNLAVRHEAKRWFEVLYHHWNSKN